MASVVELHAECRNLFESHAPSTKPLLIQASSHNILAALVLFGGSCSRALAQDSIDAAEISVRRFSI